MGWGIIEAAGLEELAARAQGRADRAGRHAAEARARAGRCVARGDPEGGALYRKEAEGHERAARANEQTAALHRRRASLLTEGEVRRQASG